jgi:hypothetical protein
MNGSDDVRWLRVPYHEHRCITAGLRPAIRLTALICVEGFKKDPAKYMKAIDRVKRGLAAPTRLAASFQAAMNSSTSQASGVRQPALQTVADADCICQACQ